MYVKQGDLRGVRSVFMVPCVPEEPRLRRSQSIRSSVEAS